MLLLRSFWEKITTQDVVTAQQEWGDGIVAIAKVHSDGGDFKARASEHIKALYAYGETPVMFKPTLASEDEFRETFDEALSYFIGTEGTEDKGFAIKDGPMSVLRAMVSIPIKIQLWQWGITFCRT